jgi:predicted Zn-dependent protease
MRNTAGKSWKAGALKVRILRQIALVVLAVAVMWPSPAPARGFTLIRDAEIERTLRAMSTPLMQAAGVAPDTVNIYIIRHRSMNAFVAGGRNIFLHTGLLMDLETPEELLGVIAHEIGHIAGGHQALRAIDVRNAQGPAMLGILAGIAIGVAGGGEAGAALAAGSQEAIVRSLLRNSRAHEASADQAALSYLERAGIDPSGLRDVIERFRGQEVLSIGSVDPYVLTHPLSTERMTLIERRVAEAEGRTWPEDPERTYWHARMRAKLEGFLRDPTRVLDDLEGKPETEFSLYRKAVAHHQDHDLSRALSAVDALISKRPDDAFYTELKGQILLESGRAEDAIPYYRRAMQLAPREPLIMAGLGRALLQPNQKRLNAEALAILKDARNADLADASALLDLSTAYERAGDRGMATLASAERYALIGDTESAVQLARRAAGVLPNGSPGWLRAQDILRLDKKND